MKKLTKRKCDPFGKTTHKPRGKAAVKPHGFVPAGKGGKKRKTGGGRPRPGSPR